MQTCVGIFASILLLSPFTPLVLKQFPRFPTTLFQLVLKPGWGQRFRTIAQNKFAQFTHSPCLWNSKLQQVFFVLVLVWAMYCETAPVIRKRRRNAVNDLAKSMAEHWSCVTFHPVRLGSCNTGKSTFTPGRFMFFFSPMAMSFMTWQHTLSDDISCWSPPTQLTAHQKTIGLCYHKIISTALNLQGQWSISRQNDATCTANPVELHSSQLWRFGNWQL